MFGAYFEVGFVVKVVVNQQTNCTHSRNNMMLDSSCIDLLSESVNEVDTKGVY